MLTGLQPVSRRVFLADLGRGAAAVAIVGLAGCAPSGSPAGSSGSAAASTSGSASPSGSASAAATGLHPPASGDGVTWQRVNLGFVSAYLLVRGGEAAVVDTGVSGSEDEIEAGLTAVGLAWDAVGHVILTHKHGDHVGSTEAVLERAAAARGYAGAEDLPAISAPRPLSAVADGDDVFGLAIVATPGHTAGHVAVYDPLAGILVAGDALGTSGGAPTLPNAQFTDDMAGAKASIAKVGALRFETLLVGHGDPIESGASAMVNALATG